MDSSTSSGQRRASGEEGESPRSQAGRCPSAEEESVLSGTRRGDGNATQVVQQQVESGAVVQPHSHQAFDFQEISGGTMQFGTENHLNSTHNVKSQKNVQHHTIKCETFNVTNVYNNLPSPARYVRAERVNNEHIDQSSNPEINVQQPGNASEVSESCGAEAQGITIPDPQSPELQNVVRILDTEGKVILCTHPGPCAETFTSDLCKYYNSKGYTEYRFLRVGDWKRKKDEKQVVVFHRAFGDLYFDQNQYFSFSRIMYSIQRDFIKLIFLVFPSVLKQLRQYDYDGKMSLLSQIQVVTLDLPLPLLPQPYICLFSRMFCDQNQAAVISLVMLGQGRFLSNVGVAKPHLERLGFQAIADAELHTYASPLEGFLLAEHGKGFIDRAVYEAAGLAFAKAGLEEVLLRVCDVRFLVERVRSSGVAQVNNLVLTLAPVHTELLMKRILNDLIDNGCMAPWVQHPCLHSPEFLQQFEKLCEKEGQLQSVQREVDHEHSLPLLYWSVWGPTPRLTLWILSAQHSTGNVHHTDMVIVKTLALQLLNEHARQKDSHLPHGSFYRQHLAMLTKSQIRDLSLPMPSETDRYIDELRRWCDDMKQRLNFQQCYLKNPSLLIPIELLQIRWIGEVVHLQLPSQHVYLALRLLTDRDVDEQDAEGNTVLHLAADAGQVQVVSLALQAGASVTVKNKAGLTPPQLAARRRTRLSPNPEPDDKVWFDFNTACGAGDLHTVQRLLCSSLSVDDRSKKGWTSLQYAARCGQIHIASLLLDLDADVDGVDADVDGVDGMQQTALHLACQQQHLSMVKLLLTHHADVNALTSDRYSALHMACESGEKEMAAVLLEHEADVNVRCYRGHTPFSLACDKNHLDVAALLLQHGADINMTTTKYGQTILYKACLKGQATLVDFLLKNNARHDLRNEYGWLGWAPLHIACRQGHCECARLLVENGADVNIETGTRVTPLLTACWNGNVDIVQLLVSHGASVREQSCNVSRPLHAACKRGHVDFARVLLRHGADVNARHGYCNSPLHRACASGHNEVVRLLLMEDGIEVNKKNHKGQTPFAMACFARQRKIIRLLLQHADIDVNAAIAWSGPWNPWFDYEQGWSPLHLASKKGLTWIVRLLIQKHADVNISGPSKLTPLHLATANGHYKVVELLLQHNANINVTDDAGYTALHLACYRGHLDIARLLLKHQADINWQNHVGRTALHVACYGGHLDIARLLLEHQADINKRDNSGRTALHLACYLGHLDIARLLLEHQADINMRDNSGRTALNTITYIGGRRDIAELLIQHGADRTIGNYTMNTPRTARGLDEIYEEWLQR